MTTGGGDRARDEGGEHAIAPMLAALVADAPIGIAVFDTELRFVFVNEYLAEINGMSAADHVGKRVADLSERLGRAVEAILARVRDTANPVVDVELIDDAPGGSGRGWRASHFPIRIGGEVVAIGATVIDIS